MNSINFSAKAKTRVYSKNNKQTMNLSETRMWMVIKSSPYRFRRQQTIGNFIVDFASIPHHIVIEMDGISHEEKKGYDKKRDLFIISHGYKILRFVGMMPFPDDLIYDYVWNKIQELEKGEEETMIVEI